MIDLDATYSVAGYRGVAFHILGPEEIADEDTEWSGIKVPTGLYREVMVGDDHVFTVDPDDLTPLSDEDYCPGCGQIGCHAYA